MVDRAASNGAHAGIETQDLRFGEVEPPTPALLSVSFVHDHERPGYRTSRPNGAPHGAESSGLGLRKELRFPEGRDGTGRAVLKSSMP